MNEVHIDIKSSTYGLFAFDKHGHSKLRLWVPVILNWALPRSDSYIYLVIGMRTLQKSMANYLIYILVPTVVWIGTAVCNNVPSVKTKLGEIQGTMKELDVFGEERKVNRFFGIPYAEPPVGDLRFRKPLPKTTLDSPFDATRFGKICVQMMLFPFPEDKNITIGEDCLTLNIYVPVAKDKSQGNQGNLAVMVWIHGGGFVCGAAQPYVADTLSAHGNVIVVTVNYRLSIWGFLSTEDEHARGNYGLWDQHLAIKWVHDNIEAFGGDPQKVTIFGESAGAGSVIYQSLFEGNKGLIKRVIAQSGSITPMWATCKNAKEDATEFGKLVGCDASESGKLVECLRNKSPETIDESLNDLNNGLVRVELPFLPTVDGEFVKEDPKALLLGDSELSAKGRELFTSIDLLMGINSDEGLLMLSPMAGVEDPETFEPNRTYFEEKLLPLILPYELGADFPKIVKDVIVHEYTDWKDPENMERRRDKLTALYSDIFFGVPLTETVSRHRSLSKTSSTYMYLFDILPSIRGLPAPSWATKANHADELMYVFFEESDGLVVFMPWIEGWTPTEWDRENSKYIMTMWSNFAKSG